MHEAGEWMDPDLNKYDLHHRVSHHDTMSDAEWEETYKAAWDAYFTWEHMETVTRRHARLEGGRPKKALQYLNEFRMLYANEGVHTLEGGVVRRKRRKSRRPDHEARAGDPLLSQIRAGERCARRGATGAASARRKALLKRIVDRSGALRL